MGERERRRRWGATVQGSAEAGRRSRLACRYRGVVRRHVGMEELLARLAVLEARSRLWPRRTGSCVRTTRRSACGWLSSVGTRTIRRCRARVMGHAPHGPGLYGGPSSRPRADRRANSPARRVADLNPLTSLTNVVCIHRSAAPAAAPASATHQSWDRGPASVRHPPVQVRVTEHALAKRRGPTRWVEVAAVGDVRRDVWRFHGLALQDLVP